MVPIPKLSPDFLLGLIVGTALATTLALYLALGARRQARKVKQATEAIIDRFLPVEQWVIQAEGMRQQSVAAYQRQVAEEAAKKKEGAAV